MKKVGTSRRRPERSLRSRSTDGARLGTILVSLEKLRQPFRCPIKTSAPVALPTSNSTSPKISNVNETSSQHGVGSNIN